MKTLKKATYSTTGKILKSTVIVSIFTMVVRIIGFSRDVVLAQIFGVSSLVDIFWMSFRVPGILGALFSDGFSKSFIPIFSRYRQSHNISEVRNFLGQIFAVLLVVLFIITTLSVVKAGYLVKIFCPGFLPGTARFFLATKMLQITFPYFLLFSVTAFIGAILNSYNIFSLTALIPAILSFVLVFVAFVFSPYMDLPEMSLTWGLLAAGIMQLVVSLIYLLKLGIRLSVKFSKQEPEVSLLFKNIMPALVYCAIDKVGFLINTVFASFLAVGSISWLYYAERLIGFPVGIITFALATVLLPNLTHQHYNASIEKFRQTLSWGVRIVFLCGAPASLAMLILAGPLVTCLFQYGNFTAHDALMTGQGLSAFGLGLGALMLTRVLDTALYARGEVVLVAKIGVVRMLIDIILNFYLMKHFQFVGLALATSISVWCGVLLLQLAIWIKDKDCFCSKLGLFAIRLMFANVLMGAFLWHFRESFNVWLSWHLVERVWHLVVLILCSIFIYGFCLLISGMRFKHLNMV
jgi:putative peptidoglycan lipid II flippase